DDPFRPLGRPARSGDEPLPRDASELAFEAGLARGRAEGATTQARLERDLVATIAAVRAWREELRTRYQPTLVGLALAIARKIVGASLDEKPERWVPIAADALRRLVEREPVTVRVSPRVGAVLRANAAELGVDESVSIVEDAGVDADACRIESQ